MSQIGKRRPRLSDEETERRMLETAAAAVAEAGLTVSLEHIRLEDVIREAGVSRSTAYRRWPQKDMFLGDLLLELARARAPLSSLGGREANETVRHTVLEHLDWLVDAEGRQRLLAELLRDLAEGDTGRVRASREWRTYLALTASFVSLPDGELREQVQEALAVSERAFNDGIVRSAKALADLFGLQLRSGIAMTWEDLGHLINAMGRGLVIKTLASSDLASRRIVGEVFGSGEEWSLPALGLFGVVSTWLEPDPEVVWDRARIEALRHRLESGDGVFEGTSE